MTKTAQNRGCNLQKGMGIRMRKSRGRFGSKLRRSWKGRGELPILHTIMSCVFLSGVLLGSVLLLISKNDAATLITSVVHEFTQSRLQDSFTTVALHSFVPNVIMLGVMSLCGYSAISQPLTLTILLSKGVLFGTLSGGLLVCYGASSLTSIGVLFLPGAVLSALVLISASNFTLNRSVTLWRLMYSESSSREGANLTGDSYLYTLFIHTFLLLCVALGEAFLFVVFGGTVLGGLL